MELDGSVRVGGEEMKKVKIDHSFEMWGWEEEDLASKQISSQVCVSKNPGTVQVDKSWKTLKETLWVRVSSRRKPACGTAHPLRPESPVSLFTVVADRELRF